jgi:6,7-dimethyl-8-ribityllumazine synthase
VTTSDEGMNRMDQGDPRDDDSAWERDATADDLERGSENVLEGWPSDRPVDVQEGADGPLELDGGIEAGSEEDAAADLGDHAPAEEPEPGVDGAAIASIAETSSEHAPGELVVPPGYPVLEGEPHGGRRAVGIVVSRFNGDVTGGLLDSALEELSGLGVEPGSVTVMPVPGAFELPIAAMALAKTRRFACIVALGCVIRGDTPHFDYVAGEAASGLQLAAIETGVPVAFGVLTLDRADQAAPRLDKGAEAVRTALEMADLFSNLRAAAAR